jgi:hypothetical protein
MGAFQHYARYGIFRLNPKALLSTKRILQRTAYFSRLGLLSMDEDAIIDISKRTGKDASIKLTDYRNTQVRNLTLDIKAILPMVEYRSYKASQLLSIRMVRNAKRSELKSLIHDFNNNPLDAATAQLAFMGDTVLPYYERAFENVLVATTLIDNGVFGFDNSDYRQELKINQGIINYVREKFTNKEAMKRLFDPAFHKSIVNNGQEYMLIDAGENVINKLDALQDKVKKQVVARLNNGEMVRKEDVLMSHNRITSLSNVQSAKVKSKVKRSFSLGGTMDISNVAF